MLVAEPRILALSSYLKEGTTTAHETLDKRIMALAPFASKERYARFLRVQLRLHHVVAGISQHAAVQQLLPSLTVQERKTAVLADCLDMGVDEQQIRADIAVAQAVKVNSNAAVLGWVYTAEGSTLGAAFLLNHAKAQMGLSESFGARHLAGHADGRGLHWRHFKSELDAVELTDEERGQVLEGGKQAFAFVYQAVEELLA